MRRSRRKSQTRLGNSEQEIASDSRGATTHDVYYVIAKLAEPILVSRLCTQRQLLEYFTHTMADEEQETDELRNFRENWKREVEEKKRSQQSWQDPAEPAAAIPEQPSTPKADSPHHSGASRSRNNALEVYSRAVKHEQAGELDDALRLYRQAFRADSNVGKSYHLKEQRTRTLEAISLTATTAEENAENEAAVSTNARSNSVVPGVVHMKPPSSPHHTEPRVAGLLASILANFPIPLSFEPEDERELLPLQRLPEELLVHILRYLGAATIERFALVSRKARMITLDATIWRCVLLLSLFSNAQRRSLCMDYLFRIAFSARCHG